VTWTLVVRLMLGSLSPGAVTSRVDFCSVPGGSVVKEHLHARSCKHTAKGRRSFHGSMNAPRAVLKPIPAPTLFPGSPHLIPRLSPPHSFLIAHAHSQSPGGAPSSFPGCSHFIHKHLPSVRGPTSFPGIPVFPSLVEFSSTLEDASSHWGVRSKQGAVCGRCQLSLLRSVSDLQPGIVAFCCGHSFHKHCLPEQACITCFTENLRKYHSRTHHTDT